MILEIKIYVSQFYLIFYFYKTRINNKVSLNPFVGPSFKLKVISNYTKLIRMPFWAFEMDKGA